MRCAAPGAPTRALAGRRAAGPARAQMCALAHPTTNVLLRSAAATAAHAPVLAEHMLAWLLRHQRIDKEVCNAHSMHCSLAGWFGDPQISALPVQCFAAMLPTPLSSHSCSGRHSYLSVTPRAHEQRHLDWAPTSDVAPRTCPMMRSVSGRQGRGRLPPLTRCAVGAPSRPLIARPAVARPAAP